MSMKNLIASIITTTKANVRANHLQERREVTDLVFSSESLDDETKKSAAESLETLNGAVKLTMDTILSSESFKGAKLTQAQKDAAQAIAGIAMNPVAALTYMQNLKAPQINGATTVSAESLGVDDILGTVSTEGFDGQALNNALYFSIAFNIGAARQDAFGEAFFPTISMDPTQSGIAVETEFTSLYTDFERSIAGTPDAKKFNKKPLVKHLFDSKLLGVDRNKVVPVLRPENEVLLVKTESYTDQTSGTDIVTAPLVFNKTIGLLGLSQTDATLAKGVYDSTDGLDRTMKVERVYYTLSGKNAQNEDVTETFRADVGILPYSNFVYSAQDHFKQLVLNFHSEAIGVHTSTTLTSKAAPSQVLAGIAGYVVKFGIKLHGEANTLSGDVSVYASNVEVVEIKNAAGDVVASGSPEYIAVMAVMSTIKLVGYTLEAYRTNTNLRTRGQLATSDRYAQIYTVPLRSGNTMLFPINNAGNVDNDAIKLAGQIQVANMKCSISAVTTLIDTANTLKSVTMNGIDSSAEILGIGRWHVSTYFKENSVDISNYVDSIKSNERLADIKAALTNKIREEVLSMYINSNYNVAFEAADGGMGTKPTVIIGTDPKIRQYLVSGDGTVNIGDEFNTMVVSTPNPDIQGRIYITFGTNDEKRNSVVNPLNFGNMVWRPTITTDVNRGNGGTVVRELHNIPSYLHFVNLPILTVINVSGVAAAIGKIAVNFRSI